MAYTSEIEKLEARYRENPKGRNFAPLADAYRKAGLIDNAIELCQAGLQLHPDYVSGHIVHGRCLVDKHDDTGAEGVFRRVLELDPENILALKVLAEIAERTNRFDVAAEWLNRLLMADPMNSEAADGLTRIRGKAATQIVEAAAAAPVATPVVEDEGPVEVVHEEVVHEELAVETAPSSGPEVVGTTPPARLSIEYMEGPFDAALSEAPTAAINRPEFELERTSEPPVSPPVGVSPGEIETFDGIDLNAATQEAEVPEGIQFEEPTVEAPADEIAVEGLARTQYEGSGLFKLDSEPEEPIETRITSPVADLPLIMPEDVEPAVSGRATPPPAVPRALRLPDDDGAADTATLSRAEPVLTETMAELYLQQGHREEALRVYEALSAQRPNDTRLQRKVADLLAPPRRPSRRGQSAGAFLKGILSARPGQRQPAAPEPAMPVAATEGGDAPAGAASYAPPASVETAPAASQAAAPAPGTPTRPAVDAISLDSVFGEEGGRGSVPALPEPAPSQPSKLPPATGGFSFDDFFGTAAAPAAEPGTGQPAASSSRPPRPSGRGRAAELDEDLDQFQAWLKSLKT